MDECEDSICQWCVERRNQTADVCESRNKERVEKVEPKSASSEMDHSDSKCEQSDSNSSKQERADLFFLPEQDVFDGNEKHMDQEYSSQTMSDEERVPFLRCETCQNLAEYNRNIKRKFILPLQNGSVGRESNLETPRDENQGTDLHPTFSNNDSCKKVKFGENVCHKESYSFDKNEKCMDFGTYSIDNLTKTNSQNQDVNCRNLSDDIENDSEDSQHNRKSSKNDVGNTESSFGRSNGWSSRFLDSHPAADVAKCDIRKRHYFSLNDKLNDSEMHHSNESITDNQDKDFKKLSNPKTVEEHFDANERMSTDDEGLS